MTATLHTLRVSVPGRRDYAEASFFDGYHFQHIADWLDAARLKRAEDAHAAFRRRHPSLTD